MGSGLVYSSYNCVRYLVMMWGAKTVGFVTNFLFLILFSYNQKAVGGMQSLNFNRSLFQDLSAPCYNTGEYHAVLDTTQPVVMMKLDTRKQKGDSYKFSECSIKVKSAQLSNENQENQDIVVMMFDISQEKNRDN